MAKLIIDAVVASQSAIRNDELTESLDHHILVLVLIELTIVLATVVNDRVIVYVRQILSGRLSVDLQVLLLRKSLTLELTQLEDPEISDQLTRARREASSRPLSLLQQHLQMLRILLQLFGYCSMLWSFSPWMTLGLTIAALPALFAELRFSAEAFRLRNVRSQDSRKRAYMERVLTTEDHAKEIRLFGLGPVLVERFKILTESIRQEDRVLSFRRFRLGAILGACSTCAFYACYLSIVTAAARGDISLGDLTLLSLVFKSSQASLQTLSSALIAVYDDNLYISNFFSFLKIECPRNRRKPRHPTARSREKGIRFTSVGFRYPGRPEWCLRDINIFVPEGTTLAIVGSNGAGKSTMVKLLTGLYKPTEGRIYIDGLDLEEWPQEAFEARISAMFQDFNRFQFSIQDNVGFGFVRELDNLQRIHEAVRQSGAHDFISALPQGIKTQLGNQFKAGSELSGGQWQKIALSRAFMRESADILILDEPTAAVDPESERALFEALRRLAREKTCVLISHRFSTVRGADSIIVLEGGRIKEQGDHTSLLARKGTYARLFRLQAEPYQTEYRGVPRVNL